MQSILEELISELDTSRSVIHYQHLLRTKWELTGIEITPELVDALDRFAAEMKKTYEWNQFKNPLLFTAWILNQAEKWTLREDAAGEGDDEPLTAVMVEPRKHPLCQAVIRNMLHFLPAQTQVIVYTHHVEWLRAELERAELERAELDRAELDGGLEKVEIRYLEAENLNGKTYSELFMTPEFWSELPGEDLIIFQTDAYFYRALPLDKIRSYREYGMVGGMYHLNIGELYYQGLDLICGGLSYRSKSAMLRSLRTTRPQELLEMYPILKLFRDHWFEDFFFNMALHHRPDPSIGCEFCSNMLNNRTENNYQTSYSIHGFDKTGNNHDFRKFLTGSQGALVSASFEDWYLTRTLTLQGAIRLIRKEEPLGLLTGMPYSHRD